MKRNRVFRAQMLAWLILLGGCASSPTRFYALDALAVAGEASSNPVTIVVTQVGVPPRVDRRQLVLGVGSVRVEEFEHWAAPLREEIGRALALNLSRQLGADQVAAWPQSLISDPELRVFVDFARFESQPGVAALSEASWSVRDRENKTVASGRRTYRELPGDQSMANLVAAHNRNLAALSADIAQAIRGR